MTERPTPDTRPDTVALRAAAKAVQRTFPNVGDAMRAVILEAADWIDARPAAPGIEELRALSEAATSGEWHMHRDGSGTSIAVHNPDNPNPGVCGYEDWDGCLGVFDVWPLLVSPNLVDAEFIAAAVNFVRTALAAAPPTPTCGRCGDVASDPLPDRCTDDDCTAVLCSLCASDPMSTACGERPERNER